MSIPSIQDWRETIATLATRITNEFVATLDGSEPPRWGSLDTNARIRVLDGINDRYVVANYSTLVLKIAGNETNNRLELYKEITQTPLQTKLKLAWMYALCNRLDTLGEGSGMSFDFDDLEIRFSLMNAVNSLEELYSTEQFEIARLYKAAKEAKIDKQDLANAIRQYKQIETYKARLESNNINEESPGFKKLMDARPKADPLTIKEQTEQYKALLTNNLTARTWGFEIEVPDAKGVDAPEGIEKGDDGSLRSEQSNDDCECDCDDCLYHECDCDFCETGSSDPEHCGNNSCVTADSAEYRSIGGIQRMRHKGMIDLCEELQESNAEKNSSAGTHIHVWARDLTANQIGQVMAIYQWNYSILTSIAGRENVNYAKRIPNQYITRLLSKNKPTVTSDKPVAVNLTPLFSSRGTIEFRQMDCNLDQDLILFWAWLMRGIVNIAKRGAQFQEFKNVTDLKGIVTIFDKYGHTLYSETPEEIVYGSKTDANRIKQPTLKAYAGR